MTDYLGTKNFPPPPSPLFKPVSFWNFHIEKCLTEWKHWFYKSKGNSLENKGENEQLKKGKIKEAEPEGEVAAVLVLGIAHPSRKDSQCGNQDTWDFKVTCKDST